MKYSRSLHQFQRVAFVAACLFGTTPSIAQLPRTISYQGVIQLGAAPATGSVDLTVNYYAIGTTTPLATETFHNVSLNNGVFSVELGSTTGTLPATVDLGKPIEIGVAVNGGAELTPHSKMLAAPYALTAYTLNGLTSSPTPKSNTIFPIPLDANGHIDASLLPSTTGLTGLVSGRGLQGGGTSGVVSLSIAPGGITNDMIAAGAIEGSQITGIAGAGLFQEASGRLNVTFDPTQFDVQNNALHLRTDVPLVSTDGEFQSLTVSGSSQIGSTSSSIFNTFGTAGGTGVVQNFIGNTVSGSSTTVNGNLILNGTFDANGAILSNLGAPVFASDAVTKEYVDTHDLATMILGQDLTGTTNAATIDPASPGIGDRLIAGINNGSATINADRIGAVANAINFTGPLTGDVIGGQGSTVLDPTSTEIGDRIIQGINHSTDFSVIDGDKIGDVFFSELAGSFTSSLNGDVIGPQGNTEVVQIQGVPVASNMPSDKQVLQYDASQGSWVPANVPANAGKADVFNPGGSATESASQVVNNANVTPSSTIVCTVEDDAHSTLTHHYVVYLTAVTSGSFTIHIHSTDGNLSPGEGALVHYMVLN